MEPSSRSRFLTVTLIVSGLVLTGMASLEHAVPIDRARETLEPDGSTGDAGTVAETIERFHAGLADGDTAAVLELLAEDLVVLESGHRESKAEYVSHHLFADMAFSREAPSRRSRPSVVVQGAVAWATSTSEVEGEFRGRTINSAGAELMVLSREGNAWRIRAIHWSSHELKRK